VNPNYGGHALDIHWAISNTHTFVRALPYEELSSRRRSFANNSTSKQEHWARS